MKWIAAAFLTLAVGWTVFTFVWAVIVGKFVKDHDDKAMPRSPVIWAMSVAFVVIGLAWAGFFRDVFPLPVQDDAPYDEYP